MDGSAVATHEEAEACLAAVDDVQEAAPCRPVRAINIRGLEITPPAGGGAGAVEWVDTRSLRGDGAYQRARSERSVELIRRIVTRFDWRRFKPPIVARTEAGLEIIDGQHSAIAAASHPGIDKIPVMVVEAASREERAGAFIGHNKDRLNVTKTQMHRSSVAARDEQALAIERVCATAGAKLIASVPGNGAFKPGDTLAVAAIGVLIKKRGEEGATAVLSVLAKAKCAPIGAGQIKAVDMLLHDPEYAGEITGEAITELLLGAPVEVAEGARLFAEARGVRVWKALAVTIFRKARKGRRSA